MVSFVQAIKGNLNLAIKGSMELQELQLHTHTEYDVDRCSRFLMRMSIADMAISSKDCQDEESDENTPLNERSRQQVRGFIGFIYVDDFFEH
jgi:hypothetical protein